MGVSDEMIAAAASAYNSAAVAEGFHSVIPSLDATHLRWMRAALLAALPHMQPSAEDTIAQVGDPVGFVCGHCGAAHKEEPFLAQIDRKQQEAQGAVNERALAYLRPWLELGTFDAPAWAVQLASILTGGDGCGTPVPATPPAPVDVRLREIIARKRAEADRDEDAAYELGRFDSERRDDLRRAAKALRADADEINLALLSAQPSADAGDGERLAYVLSRIPVTELEDWLGVSIGDYMEVPTIDEHRAAIDAAIEQGQTP